MSRRTTKPSKGSGGGVKGHTSYPPHDAHQYEYYSSYPGHGGDSEYDRSASRDPYYGSTANEHEPRSYWENERGASAGDYEYAQNHGAADNTTYYGERGESQDDGHERQESSKGKGQEKRAKTSPSRAMRPSKSYGSGNETAVNDGGPYRQYVAVDEDQAGYGEYGPQYSSYVAPDQPGYGQSSTDPVPSALYGYAEGGGGGGGGEEEEEGEAEEEEQYFSFGEDEGQECEHSNIKSHRRRDKSRGKDPDRHQRGEQTMLPSYTSHDQDAEESSSEEVLDSGIREWFHKNDSEREIYLYSAVLNSWRRAKSIWDTGNNAFHLINLSLCLKLKYSRDEIDGSKKDSFRTIGGLVETIGIMAIDCYKSRRGPAMSILFQVLDDTKWQPCHYDVIFRGNPDQLHAKHVHMIIAKEPEPSKGRFWRYLCQTHFPSLRCPSLLLISLLTPGPLSS
jgi:hypothetical protein